RASTTTRATRRRWSAELLDGRRADETDAVPARVPEQREDDAAGARRREQRLAAELFDARERLVEVGHLHVEGDQVLAVRRADAPPGRRRAGGRSPSAPLLRLARVALGPALGPRAARALQGAGRGRGALARGDRGQPADGLDPARSRGARGGARALLHAAPEH